jgi:hypothetical protein
MTEINLPGLYPDLSFEAYLADPFTGGSLSHSGARTILRTPALFAWEREHGRPDTAAFDFGRAAHRIVLGDGPGIVRVEAGDWRTKKAKDAREEARASGLIPMLADDVDIAEAMADAIRAHPLASRLFGAGNGRPEVSAFALDEPSGIVTRCRFDWLPTLGEGQRRLVIPDYKTCNSATPDDFGKAAANYGYDLQDAWYTAIALALGLAPQVTYVFVAQEKTAPYLVNVIQLDVTAKRIGAIKMRRAIELYKHCTDTDDWPGYPPEVALTSLPVWEERQYETELAS